MNLGENKQPFRLDGRVAVVFCAGAAGPEADGGGNGRAAAICYARAGATLMCVDIDAGRAESTAAFIKAEGGAAHHASADVTDEVAVKAIIEDVAARHGGLHILHNNVGMTPFGDAVSISNEVWERCFDVNVTAALYACRYALPIMRTQRKGAIVNISSILSTRISDYDMLAYCASKAALDHFTRSVAAFNAPYGIRANVIQPGLIHTSRLQAVKGIVGHHGSFEDTVRQRDMISPTLKQGDAFDIGWASVFLASDEAKYINGVVLPVDGGLANRQAGQPQRIPADLE